MKNKEVIQRVQSLYSKGVESDDSRLSNRLIYSKMLSTRSRLLHQKASKKQRISQWSYQTLPCVELIKVPTHSCPCIAPLGCEIIRSKYQLPAPISNLSDDLIQSVTSIERSLKIDRISINAMNSQVGNKYTSVKTTFFIQDKYLYIATPSKIDQVSIIGIFEDPIEASTFTNKCTESESNCIDYLEEEFPMPNEMTDTLVEMISQELVILFSQNIEDISNDSRDNLKQQSK